MPSSCSAPSCKSNYYKDERVPVFKLPPKPDQLRHARLQALHREDIEDLKAVNVCVKHFREGDIEYTHKVPNGDGTYREIPRSHLKLKEGAVPALLPGCPAYYSSSATKRSRLSVESKDDELLNQALNLSLSSEIKENENFLIKDFQDLQDKLPSLSLSKIWSIWYPNERTLVFMRPGFDNAVTIQVDVYLIVEFDLSIKAYQKGEIFPLSKNFLNDTRQLETILSKMSSLPLNCVNSKNTVTESSSTSHILSAENHIQQAIDNMTYSKSDEELIDCPELSKLQFIICQLQNSHVPKNRRRYNILTQILALKSHLISPAGYNYLQSMSSLSLPHFNTLEKLYSSFGLENEFFSFLKQATQFFSPEQKHVIIQMDEIHVKSDISCKGDKIYPSSLNPDDPTKTVFAIMVSSLYKKWSCIVRLLPCASLTAEKIFDIIKSCIRDVEDCGLLIEIISLY